MVGLPGSGKSYYANKLLEEATNPTVILSSDNYRKKLFGDENDQTHNEQVFKMLYQDMRKYLISHVDVIFDATNTSLKSRLRIMKEIEGIECDKEAYVICTPIEECIERDKNRERSVGEEVIWKFVRSFQYPQTYEGFWEIYLLGMKEYDGKALGKIYTKMLQFNQDNPHHIYNLFEHCSRLARYWPENSVEEKAALVHDIGKLFTRSVDEKGISHYYNHDSVGAYYILSHSELIENKEDLLPILHYIQYHMRAHKDFIGGKAERKYRKLFGDQRYTQLIQLAEYDKIASGTYEKHDEILEKLKNELSN